VYEINRNFRNEGISTQHNPEFTMLEFYQAYSNYHDLMTLTKELIAEVALEVNGTTKTTFNGIEIDLAPEKWQQLSMREAIIKFWPKVAGCSPKVEDFATSSSLKSLLDESLSSANPSWNNATQDIVSSTPITESAVDRINWETDCHRFIDRIDHNEPVGKVIANLFELLSEPHLQQPTIIYDFPLAVSPLSKIKPDEPDWVERFEFYIGGFEVGNAFSELNDPDDQRRRFEEQLKERERGDDEAHFMDEDYVRALGYGLPPTAGEGIGIDRLTMVLTGAKSIRDVILFPLMRPVVKAEPKEEE
jgi:lysyl-tRNA synthetase class 2